MTKQSLSSVLRQVLAVAAVVMGLVTASVSSLHLPVAVSTALVIVGGGIAWLEHYVSDPTTGTGPPAPPPAPAPAPPVAAPPVTP